MEIRYTVSDSLTPAINRALAAAVDFTPAMREIASLMETETANRFELGTAPSGVPWLPSQRVIEEASQRVIEEGPKTLVDSRALLTSIASAVTATSAAVGTNIRYAAIHQFGGTIRPRNARALRTPFGPRGAVRMPARPFLGFGAAEEQEIPRILSDHIASAFEGDRP